MKRLFYILLLPLIASVFYSCDFSIKGEGEVGEKEIKLNNIKQISAKGSCRIVYLYDNQNPRMVVESYKNIINNLKINNAGGQLSISESRNVKDTDLYNIYIYLPEMEKISLHDMVNLDMNTQLKTTRLDITLNDMSKLLANNLVVENLSVKVSDKAKINLQGTGTQLDLIVKGNGDFSAPFYEVNNGNINLSGISTAEVNVKNKLTGKISDNSELTVIGNPTKDIKQKDLAKIKLK